MKRARKRHDRKKDHALKSKTGAGVFKLWKTSGSWRDFWKRQREKSRNRAIAAISDHNQRFPDTLNDSLLRILSSSQNFGVLVSKLRGCSAFQGMPSWELDHLFQTATSYHGVNIYSAYFPKQLVFFFQIMEKIFWQETNDLIDQYLQQPLQAQNDDSALAICQLLNQVQSIDDYQGRINEFEPNYEAAAELLRPFLHQAALRSLAGSLAEQFEQFAKPYNPGQEDWEDSD